MTESDKIIDSIIDKYVQEKKSTDRLNSFVKTKAFKKDCSDHFGETIRSVLLNKNNQYKTTQDVFVRAIGGSLINKNIHRICLDGSAFIKETSDSIIIPDEFKSKEKEYRTAINKQISPGEYGDTYDVDITDKTNCKITFHRCVDFTEGGILCGNHSHSMLFRCFRKDPFV
jgi:hypothetical protein